MSDTTINYARVRDRPAGWRRPPEGVLRQCWNIWSMSPKRSLSQEEAFDAVQNQKNGLSPYYCKVHQAFHLGHRSSKPTNRIQREEDFFIELGIRACYHLFQGDGMHVIRQRCQTAAEKRGEYGRVE